MRINFGTQSYEHRSLQASAQEMINCYVEPVEGSDTDVIIVSAFGTREFATPGTGQLRGGKVINGVPYVVSGSKAYRIESNGDATELGSVPGTDDCFVDGDGENLMFVTHGLGYYHDGSTMAQVTDSDFPVASWLGVIKGCFVVIEEDTGNFFISTNRDPSEWNALEFANAEEYPDDLITGIVDHSELILFGRESGEVFYVSADADFPLTKVSSGSFEVGCEQKFTPAKADNSVFFLGNDLIGYKLDGYRPQRVTTHVIEQWIRDNKDRTFYGFTFSEEGHKFYCLTCSAGSYALDISTGRWHRRRSYGQDRWRTKFALYAYKKWLVGMYDSNEVGYLDPDTFQEFDEVLRSSATSAPYTDDNRWVQHDRLGFVFERGVGTFDSSDANPTVMVDYSDDRGETWSDEISLPLGAHGQYEEQADIYRLGRSKGRVYRYAIAHRVRRTLILSTLEAKSGGY